jgi:glutamate dehydrogenase/leucine dehydrogenase
VFLGVKAALGWTFGNDSPKGRTVAIQGTGAVGSALAKRLVEGRRQGLRRRQEHRAR